MTDDGQHICTICKKPVYAEQGVYTITGNHWDCEQAEWDKVDAGAGVSLRRRTVLRKQSGVGRTKQRLAIQLTERLRKELPGLLPDRYGDVDMEGLTVHPEWLISQPNGGSVLCMWDSWRGRAEIPCASENFRSLRIGGVNAMGACLKHGFTLHGDKAGITVDAVAFD